MSRQRPAASPLVSVIVPAYNAGRFLADTIDGVLAQSHPRYELLIVDDGSSDDTRHVVERYGSRVRYLYQPNAGTGAARNRGLERAEGDYVAFLDHDDVWRPDKLAVQLAVAARRPGSGLIVCDGVQVDGQTVLARTLIHDTIRSRLERAADGELTGWFYRDLLRHSAISCPAQTLIPRHVIEAVGPFLTSRDEASDSDYYLRIASRYPVTFHRDSLVQWRYLPGSRSGPLERRALVWGLMNIRLLQRHGRTAADDDRALAASCERTVARHAALNACCYGLAHDMAFAHSYLSALSRLHPDHAVAAIRVATRCLPEGLVGGIRPAARRLVRSLRPRRAQPRSDVVRR